MHPVIDYRNGRYQGQLRNRMPHGIGILVDKNFLFCIGEWQNGEIQGNVCIVYPSGRIFCGRLANKQVKGLCTYELAQDHVSVLRYGEQRQRQKVEKIVGIQPLLQNILEIDNTDPRQARVQNQHTYSLTNQQINTRTISEILALGEQQKDVLVRQRHCLKWMQKCFAEPYEDVIQFMISENRGKKQFFFGIRGEGLGIKIEPIEEPGFKYKKAGRVYITRAVGMFTPQNQMKQLGLKTINNAMKGLVIQQGIFSLPNTLITYQPGKRPVNSLTVFYNHMKRSLHFRDEVISTSYLYVLENYVVGFNNNLRKVQTQKLAQVIIQNPNNSGPTLMDIQRKRAERQRQKSEYFRKPEQRTDLNTPSRFVSDGTAKIVAEGYTLQRAKDEILRSVSKRKRGGDNSVKKVDYTNVEYVDPNYVKISKLDRQPRNYQAYQQLQPLQKGDKSYYKDRDEYERGYQNSHDRYSPSRRQFTNRVYSPERRDNRRYEDERRYDEGRRNEGRGYQYTYEKDSSRNYDREYDRQYNDRNVDRGYNNRAEDRGYNPRGYRDKSTDRNFSTKQFDRSYEKRYYPQNKYQKDPAYRPSPRQFSPERSTSPYRTQQKLNRSPYQNQRQTTPPRQYHNLPNNNNFRRRLFKDSAYQQ